MVESAQTNVVDLFDQGVGMLAIIYRIFDIIDRSIGISM